MSLKQLKIVLAVGFLGSMLTGCSAFKTDGSCEIYRDEFLDNYITVKAGAEAIEDTSAAAPTAEAVKEAVANASDADKNKLKEMLAALQGKRVNFEFDKSEVTSEFRDTIKMHAEYLNLDKDARVTVEGHCDERGSREYNLALGERRANAVKNALIAEGVEADRIDVNSFGEDRPLVAESNEEAWAQNRRAEFVY